MTLCWTHYGLIYVLGSGKYVADIAHIDFHAERRSGSRGWYRLLHTRDQSFVDLPPELDTLEAAQRYVETIARLDTPDEQS